MVSATGCLGWLGCPAAAADVTGACRLPPAGTARAIVGPLLFSLSPLPTPVRPTLPHRAGSSPSTGARAQQQLQRAGLGAHGGGGYGALDEIDRSDPELWEEEEEDEYGDEDDAYGEEDFLGGYPGLLGGLMGAGGAGAGVLGGPVDDTLLRQIPVQVGAGGGAGGCCAATWVLGCKRASQP